MMLKLMQKRPVAAMADASAMRTRGRTRAASALAAAALAILAGMAQAQLQCELGILTPETLAGNNPATDARWKEGEKYRFAFFTSVGTTALSADIATYNTFVQNLANASTVYKIGASNGVTWKAIGSTATVNASDNTMTDPHVNGDGHAIFLLDGKTVVARNYWDLWDGTIENIINLTEQGTVQTYWPWTGSYWDGTAAPGQEFSIAALGGGEQDHQGESASVTNWIWRMWTADPPENLLNMYAVSEPLSIKIHLSGAVILVR